MTRETKRTVPLPNNISIKVSSVVELKDSPHLWTVIEIDEKEQTATLLKIGE